MSVKQLGGNRWQLTFQPMTVPHTVASGDEVVYEGRTRLQRQDWLRFPVSGVSRADGEAYAAWLRSTGKLRGARLCTEHEWERAARGADDREYPHGGSLAPADANFDEAYGKKAESEGPDVVGSHPESQSPFGVQDLAGNAVEAVVSSVAPDESCLRGGGYAWDALSSRSINRNPSDAQFRTAESGFRTCASFPSM
jgi:formylglycine-generating enzyme required for sulfatase activity